MPTFRHGRNTDILVNGYDLSTYFRETTMASSADTPETTAYKSEVKTYVVGMTDGRLSLGGMFSGDEAGVDEIFNLAFGVEDPTIATYAPEGTAIGRRVYGLAGHVNSYQVNGSVGDIVAVSAEMQGTGGVKGGVSLLSHETDILAGGNGASVDDGLITQFGGWGILHVLEDNDHSGALTFDIEHSADGTTWVALGTFDAIDAGVGGAQRIEIEGTINRYVRATFDAAGAGTAHAHVSLMRAAG